MPDNTTGEQHKHVATSSFEAEIGPVLADLTVQPRHETVEYLGVVLEKGSGQEVQVPDINAEYIEDEFSQDIQQRLAIAFAQHQPTLLEGGTSLGKSTTVRKMAAELGWSVHSVNMVGSSEDEDLMGDFGPNPDKKTDADAEFAFFDGPVTAAIEEAAQGHKVLLLIDEINVSRPNVMIRLHEIIDAFEKSSTINITKKGGKHLRVIRENLNIVGLANPPSRGGSGYAERTPLDKAQFRRWNYQKLPDEMPEEAFEHSVNAMFGVEPMSQKAKIAEGKYLHSGERVLSRVEVGRIPGMVAMAEQYKIFHTTMKGKIETGLGRDQPQPISFDDREEVARVTEFVAHFYNGDINATMHKALEYYYANKIADATERATVLQLISGIHVEVTGDMRRRALNNEAFDTNDPEVLQSPEYVAFKLNELLEKGAKPKLVLQSLAGNSSEGANMIRLELKDKPGTIKDYGKSLAGVVGIEADALRGDLISNRRYAAYCNSMTGIGDRDEFRNYSFIVIENLPNFDAQDKQAVFASLAGIDIFSNPSRAELITRIPDLKSPRALGEAYMGVGLVAIQTEANNRNLSIEQRDVATAWAISGSDLNTAWAWRDGMVLSDDYGKYLISLGGLDSDIAREARNNLKDQPGLKNELALSLSGVYSPQAWAMRDELFGDDPDLYALSIGGNWVLNALHKPSLVGSTPGVGLPSTLLGPEEGEEFEEPEELEE